MSSALITRTYQGRVHRLLAVTLAVLLLMSVTAISHDAQATTEGNTNSVDFWCGSEDAGTKYEPVDTPFVVPVPPADTVWSLLVLKAASGDGQNQTWAYPTPGAAYSHSSGHANSHAILCEGPGSSDTTTSSTTTTSTTIADPDTPQELRIDIEKATNGIEADEPAGPTIPVGESVTWTYVVTNTGEVPLSNVSVTDPETDGAPITCPSTALVPGASMECSASSLSWYSRAHTTHANLGTVTATYEEQTVDDQDPSHYTPTLFCPIPENADSIVVDIYSADPTGNGGFMLGRDLSPDTVGPVAVNIPAGTYRVSLASYDAHSVKGGQHQSAEQYRLSMNGGTLVSSSTPDLPDADDLRWWTVDAELVVPGDVTTLAAEHTGPSERINSVYALCAVFDPILVPDPAIDIEKATNGIDADQPTGPEITVGDPVTWTYVVSNTGNVDLSNVAVTDDKLGDVCTFDTLVVGASETCSKTGVAELGQYANLGTTSGMHGDVKVTDNDPSHYTGIAAPVPSIHIEKATNGQDADTYDDAEILASGADVTWTYVVTNPGTVALSNVVVTDNMGVIPVYQSGDTNTNDLLEPTETWKYAATGSVGSVDYENLGTVTGFHIGGDVTDTDPSHYKVAPQVEGTSQLGDTVWLDANNNGIQDNGEVGYNGAKVILTDADGNVVETLTTATGAWVGFYKFVGLDAGTYTATLDLSTIGDYGVTTAKAFTVVLAEGDDFTQADFGLYAEEELPKTGVDSEGLTLFALGLLILGSLAVLSTRKRRAE